MASQYLEVCKVTRWFWWRIFAVIILFALLSTYFFYDWKVGYPKKNYQRAQYETFVQAKKAFLKHTELGLSSEFWSTFVRAQQRELPKNLELFEPSQITTIKWPDELKDYKRLLEALKSNSTLTEPLLWSDYKVSAQMTEPLPKGYQKDAYDENYHLLLYKTFQEASRLFQKHISSGGTAKQWELISSMATLAFEKDEALLLTDDNKDEGWPEILFDYNGYYALAQKEIESGVSINEPYLWKEYTSQKKWSQQPPASFYTKKQINEQLYYGVGSVIVSLGALVLALVFTKRFIAVDKTSYYAPNGKVVRFQDLVKIDKRNWNTKGLATLYYKTGQGGEGKVKVDGMVYGQFDKSEGAPAERLFKVILDNFKGELIDYEELSVEANS